MATTIKSRIGLMKAYEGGSIEVKKYFEYIPSLLTNYPLDVCLAYVFARLELAQNMALYCGVVKVHKANSELAMKAIGIDHITRGRFIELYMTVYNFDLPKDAKQDLKGAEGTRDLVMHGKRPSDDKMRNAIASVLEYAETVNKQLFRKHAFKPFGGDLRGFSGRSAKLDKRTTRFMLKGMGFSLA